MSKKDTAKGKQAVLEIENAAQNQSRVEPPGRTPHYDKSNIEGKKILMFGWELPPFNSGGLGVACFELAEALSNLGAKITFVLPKQQDIKAPFMHLAFANSESVKIKEIDTLLHPYIDLRSYKTKRDKSAEGIYERGLIGEVKRYALAAREIAKNTDFDLIHAHDWLSFLAGMEAKKISGKPLIVHVHSTEFDRSGNGPHVHDAIYNIEKQGLMAADKIITVSNLTKSRVCEKYGIDPQKVEVVHNGINPKSFNMKKIKAFKKAGKKIILFVGRITIQKGPDYFIGAAEKVLKRNRNTVFIMAGCGDMEKQVIEQAAQKGISDKIVFTGYIRDDELHGLYEAADLYVMPSVSEPFGIVALEAMSHHTPILISKQSGVAEVVKNALKVDFWNTDEIANQILATLEYKPLKQCLSDYGAAEIPGINWQKSAEKCAKLYLSTLAMS